MGLVEKTERNWPDWSYVNMTSPWSRNAVTFPRLRRSRGGSHHCPAELLFISDGIFSRGGKKKKKKKALPFAPWEPNRVPVPTRSLGPMRWSDPDAAEVWKGTAEECAGFTAALIDRGQHEVGSHVSWLRSLPLSRSLSLFTLSLYPIHPACCQVVSWCLCFLCPVEAAWSSAGRRQRYAPRLARCLTSAEPLMNSFTVGGWISNRNLQTPRTSSMNLSIQPAVRR